MPRCRLRKLCPWIFAASLCFAGGDDQDKQSPKFNQLLIGVPAPKVEPAKGKYFVTLISLYRTPAPDIKLELRAASTGPGGNILCAQDKHPAYPITAKQPFCISSARSRVPVTISVKSGSAAIRASKPGEWIVTPEEGDLLMEAAPLGPERPNDKIHVHLEVAAHSQSACANLISPAQGSRIRAAEVINLLGNPAPFSFVARGKEIIAVYSSRYPLTPADRGLLRDLEINADMLARKTPDELGITPANEFKVEFTMPHAAALGDLAAKVSSLHVEGFSVQNVGSDRVRISSPSTPSCGDWVDFLADLRHLVWQVHPEPFSTKLFYLNAPDVSAALNAAGAPASGGGGSESQKTQKAGAASDSAAGKKSPNTVGSSEHKDSDPVAPLGTDLIVFGDSHPGDDAVITETRRILAALDLPRPEMIISAWVLQNSSTDGKAVGNFNDIVQRMVSENNEGLQKGVLNAWRYLKAQMRDPANYFDNNFYWYVVNRYVANLPAGSNDPAEGFLQNRSSAIADKDTRAKLQFCGDDQYCLGYAEIFTPLQPRLTDLLLAVIGARYAWNEAYQASCRMENPAADPMGDCSRIQASSPSAEDRSLQKSLEYHLDLKGTVHRTCEEQDLNELVSHFSRTEPAGIRMNCFRETAAQLLDSGEKDLNQPHALGLLRAALADFLFNYKMSQQYPHEFRPYDLGRSADVLNSALRPIVEAFDRDVRTFQRYLGAEVETAVDDFNKKHNARLWFVRDKATFTNNGLVTIRTISGQNSTVDAISQSFLDSSSLPQVSELANSILNAGQSTTTGSTATTTTTTPAAVPGGRILENLSPNQAQVIAGALSAYQSSKVQIGRELSLDVTPRSLNGAVSAEIAVSLKAGETASPNYWGGTQAGNPSDLSRVATHNTSTRVRVDSIRIFDVSAFTAVLQRSRSRFPLLPPLVEIPYIGTAIGVPLPPATEYHSSTALLSAIVVPTAADIASELVFKQDQVVDAGDGDGCVWPGQTKGGDKPPCAVRRAISLKDLNNQPIREFHQAMLGCFAMNVGCDSTFASVLHTEP